jgi:hypothetical protein
MEPVQMFQTERPPMQRIFKITMCLLLGGCGSVSTVVPMGKDIYMVSSHGVLGNGSSAAEKVKVVQAANAHCEGMSRQVEVVHTESVDPFFGRAPSAKLQFRCNAK